ncbi:MAG: multidrug transporter [Patiriisocius sp.]|uniref:multidrug transporter n=1 Tax=Patiriisocius sp. TaxID=2822396 RepID=UPI003EF9540F
MKTNYFLVSLAIVAMLFASCEADDTADIIINDNSIDNSSTTNGSGGSSGGGDNNTTENIGGTMTTDLTLSSDVTYILTEALIMTDGTTLNIPACTVIRANNGAGVYIAIAQGATINANGSANCPIVMTSNSPTQNAGDWGGLIVLGKAPINSVAGGNATSTSEIGGLPYGGSDANDASGNIRYVRVEYSGGAASGSSENNGFSFYGVGAGTNIEYIQAYEGADDGVEFFGGTANANFVVVTNCQDDSVDWTEGFSGNLTDVYIKHGNIHDKGIEADGFNTDIGNNSSPIFYSKPTVTNVTIVGLGSGAPTTPEAVRLRAGTQGVFTNFLIRGFDEGFDLDGDMGDSPTGQGVIDGNLSVTDVTFDDVTTKLKNDTGFTFTEADFISGDGNGTGTDFATWGLGWTRN